MTAWAMRELRRSAGRYAASVAVVAVVTAFAVLLITAIGAFTGAARAQGADVGTTKVMLAVVGGVFLGIAVVVAVIVVSNTFSTIAAGRIKDIAVLRLIGATGKQVRRTALVGVGAPGKEKPVLLIEREADAAIDDASLLREVAELASKHDVTRRIVDFRVHPGAFPVDARHNAKIEREKLSVWVSARS